MLYIAKEWKIEHGRRKQPTTDEKHKFEKREKGKFEGKKTVFDDGLTNRHSLAIHKRYGKQSKSEIVALDLNRANSILAFGLKLGKTSSIYKPLRFNVSITWGISEN